mmetsp:Transcript_16406/g.29255  ORF Transcript_16406/g.29255 Transcript_16406/m.29255 type:complete len:294 (+) Transcript_16406:625-1506(+)
MPLTTASSSGSEGAALPSNITQLNCSSCSAVGRLSGSFVNIASISALDSGDSRHTGKTAMLTSSCRIWWNWSSRVSLEKGVVPVSSWYSTVPQLNRSALCAYSPSSTSGAMNPGAPTTSVSRLFGMIRTAVPKSITLRSALERSFDVSSRFSGAMVRWTIPFAWRYFSALSSCLKRRAASRSLKLPCCDTASRSGPPAQSSIIMWHSSLSSSTSFSFTMCGWSSPACTLISTRNASRIFRVLKLLLTTDLQAYSRPSSRWYTLYVSPVVPCPRSVSRLYRVLRLARADRRFRP